MAACGLPSGGDVCCPGEFELDQGAAGAARIGLVNRAFSLPEVVIYLVTFLLLFCVTLLGLAHWRFGIFAPIRIAQPSVCPWLLLGKVHRGDYHQAGQITDQVYEAMKAEAGIETTKVFGLHCVSPKMVEPSQLRSLPGGAGSAVGGRGDAARRSGAD